MTRQLIFIGLLLSICLYGLIKGGRSERSVAAICLCAAILTSLAVSPFGARFRGVEIQVFYIDALTFLAFFAVALFSTKFWPMWVTAMQGVSLLSHLSPLLPGVIPWAYGNAIALWSYPILIVVGIATFRNGRRFAHHRSPT
jgi:hypothetical protein